MSVRPLSTFPRVALMETDNAGVCTTLEAVTAPAVGNPKIGYPYWQLTEDLNPWNRRGVERFDRIATALRRTHHRRNYDRHEVLRSDGSFTIHLGVTLRRDDGGLRRVCYDIEVGSPELRQQIGAEANLIVRLGENFLGCLVDQEGTTWWWPSGLAERKAGVSPLHVLGMAPPLRRRGLRQLLGPPVHPINDPHQAEPVWLPGGTPAIVSSAPLAGGAISLWVIEIIRRLYPVTAAIKGHM